MTRRSPFQARLRHLPACLRAWARHVALLTVTGFFLVWLGAARAEDSILNVKERQEIFAWLKTLEYPDLKNAKFVRVALDKASREDEPRSRAYVYGYLLADNAESFQILATDLSVLAYPQPKAGNQEVATQGQVSHYESCSFTKFVEGHFAADAKHDEDDQWRRRGSHLSGRAEIIFLAWVAAEKGNEELAARLFDKGAELPNWLDEEDLPPTTLREVIATEMAHAELWRAIVQLGEATVSRAELLKKLERIIHHFPKSEHLDEAQETAATLRKMVAEDEEYAAGRQVGRPYQELSPQEQIRELVFQLRDQRGSQFAQPGSCDIFGDWVGAKDTPAQKLVAFGYDAMPVLIEALGDDRFTRAVEYYGSFYQVKRVKDCAEEILSRIASRRFGVSHRFGAEVSDEVRIQALQQEVSEWFNLVSSKGEKVALQESVAVGDETASELADVLAHKYPTDALPFLIAGIGQAHDRSIRSSILSVVAALPGDSNVDFLLHELKEGPTLDARLTAAQALNERQRPEGASAMIAEWLHPRAKPGPAEDEEDEDQDERDDALVAFLARSCGASGIAALATTFAKESVSMRMDIVEAFAQEPHDEASQGGPPLRPEALALIREALDDTEERIGMWRWSGSGPGVSDPRICDVAADLLHNWDQDRFPFELGESLHMRERGRIALKNVFRAEQGLPLLALPKVPEIKPTCAETLEPLLNAAIDANESRAEPARHLIEQLGVGALPAILKRRDEFDQGDLKWARLDKLASRLALIVTQVNLAEKSLQPDEPLRQQLNAFKDKRFDPEQFQVFLTGLQEDVPRLAYGFRVTIVRGQAGNDLTLMLDLLDPQRAAGTRRSHKPPASPDSPFEKPTSWNYATSVRIDSSTEHDSVGSTGRNGLLDDVPEEIEPVVLSRANQSLEVRYQMTGNWRK